MRPARNIVESCGILERHSNTGNFYLIVATVYKHRRRWVNCDFNETEREWRPNHTRKGAVPLRTATQCCEPWDAVRPKRGPISLCSLQPRDWLPSYIGKQRARGRGFHRSRR